MNYTSRHKPANCEFKLIIVPSAIETRDLSGKKKLCFRFDEMSSDLTVSNSPNSSS